ncbi:glycerophosphodiester phosphodiesterase domain-containing protein 5-like [Hyla sarda]|uniref:glycerophosphodiester phosphodiesterase domain-containing protein 5-like n=1 Tax=Hyla sarda TaxID=327740 RepID=UPI0024C3705A|nr:glycerophosphodiester phosphodiesterase domain-containing protein 5-like [Hyla sarda]XP_056417121.1 glycerophosphodiester phosphodiesterase domain-containing protein 5-like [Hyla sarda]XP_056417122.1 glycerophosphodiester phosphodiesterase domain-containing protein 5-like [Hyla sarda]
MGSSSTTLRRLRLGKLKIVRRRLLQHYEHQPFISLLAGLYSCRWKRYQRQKTESGQCCCKWKESVFFLLLVVTFCLSLVFLYSWGEAKNDYNDFDWFTYKGLGYWFLWSLLILVVVAVLFAYIAVLVVLAVCLLSEGQQLYLHWSHKGGMLFVLIFFIGALVVLSNLWGEEWAAVRLSFQVTAPYLHIGSLAAMTLLSWPVALYFVRMTTKLSQAMIVGPYIAVLLLLYFLPLGMYSPCIREKGTLGAKPLLIGHRGSPTFAPENTQMSFEKTIEYEGDGLETDVTISYDGVPFLMHDSTLGRTTNVKDVFPNFTNINSALFPWDMLENLNAGKWFTQKPPFSQMGSLSSEEQQRAANQSIYKLVDYLRLAHRANKTVIFDLYRPPQDHPYRDTWINRTLEVINEAAIDPRLVLWLANDMRSFVQSVAPGFQQTLGFKESVEELVKYHIVKLNLPYSMMSQQDISKYAAANITTNLYVVSEPWLFSLAWCSGAYSVTTNSVRELKKIEEPMFLLTPAQYSLMWILTDLLSALLITLIFVLHWWRERGLPCCPESNEIPDSGFYNTFKTEMDMSVSEDSYGRSLPTTPSARPNGENLGSGEIV